MFRTNTLIYTAANIARKFGARFDVDAHPKVREMKQQITKLGKIEFKIDYYPDGSWDAVSTNIDGIITGGTARKDISKTIKDSIFTYFEIPPHLCSDALLRGDNEPVSVTQRIYA